MHLLLGPGTGGSPLSAAELARLYLDPAPPRTPKAGRPWVVCNMVASIDGAVTDAEGRSGGLSNDDDRAVFRLLREAADVVLVGAGTARAENYGPARLSDEATARRLAAGRTALPRLAVVTGRVDLAPGARLFEDGTQRPLVITSAAGAARASQLPGADVLAAGETEVDLDRALRALHEAGHRVVLCEGGPALNASLFALGAIDEVCLTVAPTMVGGGAGRLLADPGSGRPLAATFAHVLEGSGALFLRALLDRPAG